MTTGLDERLKDLIAPLKAERDQLDAEVRSVTEERDRINKGFNERLRDIRDDIRKIDRAIKPLTGEDEAAKKKRRKKKSKKWAGVSQERIDEILAGIQELVEETDSDIVTIPQVAQKMGIDLNTCRRVIDGVLREREVVMKGGRAPKTGGGQPPIEYKYTGVRAHA